MTRTFGVGAIAVVTVLLSGFWAAPTLGDNDAEATPLPTPRELGTVAPEVMGRVARLRGLAPTSEVPIRVVHPRESVADPLVKLDDSDRREIRAEEKLLKRIGLLPREMDLVTILESALGAGLGGYYSYEDGDIAIVDGDGLLDTAGEWTLGHEYVHALQDQHFGLEAMQEAASAGDERSAIAALIEGDATFLMNEAIGDAIAQSGSPTEQAGLTDEDIAPQRLPPILERILLFPYFDGTDFVQQMWGRGGWSAVDEVWLDPPASTEQVMHPERYPDDRPVRVDLPDVAALLGDGWTPAYEITMGELRIGVFVAGDESNEIAWLTLAGEALPNAKAAAGWGGDKIVTVDGPEGEWAVVWQTAWDTAEDATEFAEAARQAMDDLDGAHRVAAGADVADAAPDDQSVLLLIADGATTMSLLEEVLEFS